MECKYCDEQYRKQENVRMIKDLAKAAEYLMASDTKTIRVEVIKKIKSLLKEV